jgi:probable selenium-dependent hydroxylase accessory protein YqeC
MQLWDALNLDAVGPPAVVTIVGGGGKTTLLYRLGREAEQRGLRAVLSGTARFTPAPRDQMPPTVQLGEPELIVAVERALANDPVVVASTRRETKGRLGRISSATADAIAEIEGLGLLALEADGSKMLPFKAPDQHEPAIPPSATHVVAIVGVDAIDAPLDATHVHRPERIRALVGESETTCTIDVIARVLASEDGGRQNAGTLPYAVLVNKADLAPQRAADLAVALRDLGMRRVVIASLRDEANPVRDVLS